MTTFGLPPSAMNAQLDALPGVGFAVLTVDGERSDFKSYGVRFGGESRFEIGSISKTFTAALLADMVGRGEVAPDDPIERLLPAGCTAPTFEGRHITLLDLATQSSGLPRLPSNLMPRDPNNPYADFDEPKLLAFLATYQLQRAPGARFEYSNLGYGLLGYLLARRLHLDYATAIRTRVLEPLGMTHTVLEMAGAPPVRTVAGHNADGDPVSNWTFDALAGAGAVVSTPNDMLRYARANLEPPPGILGAALRAAQRPVRDADFGRRIGYAWLTQPNGNVVWHNGATAGFRSLLGLDPSHRRAIVVLANAALDSVDSLGLHALDPLVPPPLPPPTEVAIDRAKLEKLVGTYQFDDGSTCSVTLDDRGLIAGFDPPAFRARLHAISATTFSIRTGGIVLRFNDLGPATALTVLQPGQPDQTAQRTR